MLAVETTGLTKDYELGNILRSKHRALDHLDLEVEEGEIFGLIGPNGAGKTTTLKLLMGLVFPTQGTARILGESIGSHSMREQIGYLPELPYFYDYLTGRELLDYFGQLFGLSRSERRSRSEELLEKVRITEFADLPLQKYSKGMIQRLGIAQALINQPRLVFLDEPMSGLDPVGRHEVTTLLRELKGSGVSVFFCSHILPDVEAICDRVAILNKGKLVNVGQLQEILDLSVRSVEIVIEGISRDLEERVAPHALRITRRAERVTVVFSGTADFNSYLPLLLSQGAKVHSVTSEKETLEDYFVREINKEITG